MGSKLYSEYAPWWPLFADPGYYANEAQAIIKALSQQLGRTPRTVLDLGCGGGTLASHLKSETAVTAVDLSPQMIAVSQALNPDCEHIVGDMRTLGLGRTFDAVILHDAVNYLTTFEDLVLTLTTTRHHLAIGGRVIVLPDDTTESFQATTSIGGRDDAVAGRGLRYLLWTRRFDDTSYTVDFAIMLREENTVFDVLHESHRFGLFSRTIWQRAFSDAGFPAVTVARDPLRETLFLATRTS